MKTDRITRILADEYTRISEVRKLIARLAKADNLSEEEQELFKKLEEKEGQLKVLYKSKNANFETVLKGSIGLGGKPNAETIKILAEQKTDVVLTLLKTKEKGVQEIKEAVEINKMDWIWFPLSASELSLKTEFKEKFNTLLLDLIRRLEAGQKIFIHCAAGVHRTGAFSNALFQKIGYSTTESKTLIRKIRPVTAIEAIPKHWAWSERVINGEQ